MIEVPIDKIIPLDDALGDISKIIDTTHNEKGICVLTKNGKPYAAIIDIDYLEHLPEMDNPGKTKKIHEIGQEEETKPREAKPKEPQPVESTPPQEKPPAPTIEMPEETPPAPNTEPTKTPPPATEEPPAQNNQPKKKPQDIYTENIGPWQKPQDEPQTDEQDSREPPDLPI